MFNPIQLSLAHEIVEENIRAAIRLGRFLPGDKLPPERTLADQLGVSRTVLRQAIKNLENAGYLNVKRGAKGGLVVNLQSDWKGDADDYKGKRLDDLNAQYEFRTVIEAATARLAAQRRTKNDLAVMRSALERMESLMEKRQTDDNMVVPKFMAADREFHFSIAEATRNPGLNDALENYWATRFIVIGQVFRRVEDQANDEHRDLFEAIEAGNADLAERTMIHHIELSRENAISLLHR